MKTIVFELRAARARRASSISALISLMPVDVAEKVTKRARVVRAMIRASVVFPDPGGPQKIMEGMRSFSMAFRRNRPGARMSWSPTISSSDCGRNRSGSGASALRRGSGREASSKREPVMRNEE